VQSPKEQRVERRLVAILAADVSGYSRLMSQDEAGTLSALAAARDIMDSLISSHGGRIANTAGDSVLAEFASAVDAVQCAVTVQERLEKVNSGIAKERRLQFRIGVHVGDVVVRGGDLLGDGVNVASRLEELAQPGGIAISGAAHSYVRKALPMAYADIGERRIIDMDEPVRVYAVPIAAPAVSTADSSKPLSLPDKPSIAVLPFTIMSGNLEYDYVADGLTEDLISAFARLRWLFVIARNSSFAYKGKAVNVRQVAQELGVRYVLEGSVRVAGGRIRVSVQLADAETGKHLWADRYDRELRDLFAVQDEITERVVATVEPHLYVEEGFRAASKPPDSIDAWGLVARAVVMLNKFDREQNVEARALLHRAIALEPNYARAHALLGWAVYWATYAYWLADREESLKQAAAHAQNALMHDATDPWARMVFGLCLSSAGQHERALGELQAALTLNPSFALGHIVFGWALLRSGHFDEALVETGWALRMSPVDSFAGFYTAVHGLALVAARQFEEALPYLRASVAAAEHVGQYHSLISCCGHLGLIEEAQGYIAARNRLGPPVRLSVLRRNLANFAHCDVFLEGLRKAGVPE
jgi:adenylate cyclase